MPNKSDTKKRIPKGKGREKLLTSARALFLEDGFQATSPQAIYAKSGVGQGSFYHHFDNKSALMTTVLEDIANTQTAILDNICLQTEDPKKRIEMYLDTPRLAKKGCKLGRFMYETSVAKSTLVKPIKQHFDRLNEFLIASLDAAQNNNQIPNTLSPETLAHTISTQIQGGYILSRIYNSNQPLENAIVTLRSLIGLDTHII